MASFHFYILTANGYLIKILSFYFVSRKMFINTLILLIEQKRIKEKAGEKW